MAIQSQKVLPEHQGAAKQHTGTKRIALKTRGGKRGLAIHFRKEENKKIKDQK